MQGLVQTTRNDNVAPWYLHTFWRLEISADMPRLLHVATPVKSHGYVQGIQLVCPTFLNYEEKVLCKNKYLIYIYILYKMIYRTIIS